jgi:hypothetical protein
MNTNPRFAVLLANYVLYDRLTLLLATAALVAVLFGFLLTRYGSGKLGHVYTQVYYGFLLLSYILILAGLFIYS